jgi:hypothetical protein
VFDLLVRGREIIFSMKQEDDVVCAQDKNGRATTAVYVYTHQLRARLAVVVLVAMLSDRADEFTNAATINNYTSTRFTAQKKNEYTLLTGVRFGVRVGVISGAHLPTRIRSTRNQFTLLVSRFFFESSLSR